MNLKAVCKQNTCFALVLVHSRSWKYLFEGLVLSNYLRVHNFRAYGCQAQIPTSLNQQLEKMSLEHCWFKEAARQQLWLAASSLQVQTSQALSMWITSACLHLGLPPSSSLLSPGITEDGMERERKMKTRWMSILEHEVYPVTCSTLSLCISLLGHSIGHTAHRAAPWWHSLPPCFSSAGPHPLHSHKSNACKYQPRSPSKASSPVLITARNSHPNKVNANKDIRSL